MALKLSQVLDLAIGVDNASVNLLHLREVLVTVIATLDIGHVTVRKCEVDSCDGVVEDDGPVGENELDPNDVDHTLPQSEAQENTSTDRDELTETLVTAENENVTVVDKSEHEDKVKENDTTQHETNGDTEKHESETIQHRKLERSESAFSKVSNVSKLAHNSTLSSKVFALEENLKRLQNIVGSLISQVDGNNNVTASSQFDQVEQKSRAANGPGDEDTQHRERSTSVGPGYEQDSGSKLDSGLTGESMRGPLTKPALKRPVTQPVLASAKHVPVLPRSKTAGLLPGYSSSRGYSGKKNVVRRGSLLEKIKQRQFFPVIDEEVQQGEHVIEGVTVDKQDTQGEMGIADDISKETEAINEEFLPSDTDSEGDIEELIEQEIETALSDPNDPQNTTRALRLGLEQMQRWRQEFEVAQENFRVEVEACRNFIQSLGEEMNILKAEKKNQETENFNAAHHVHRQIIELQQKQARLNKTVNGLVDEFNRHESTFSDILNSLEKLDEQKVDKVLLSTQVDDKANKDELRDKVSVSMLDESFSILDQALNDALEKMSNQMSMEEALRETLNEMQSGMELKLNREDMENLKEELEARIKEVRAAQEKGLVGKNEPHGDPAGFKRYMEKGRCISCDRDVEIEPSQAPALPSLPKSQPLGGIPPTRSRDVHVLKKTADEEYRLSRLKAEMIQVTGLHDFLPISQRFCGGRHTVTRGNKRHLGPTHLNDYIVVREADHVSLPSREFIVPSRDSGLRRLLKQKLPAINDAKHLPAIRKERNILKENGEKTIASSDKNEQITRVEK